MSIQAKLESKRHEFLAQFGFQPSSIMIPIYDYLTLIFELKQYAKYTGGMIPNKGTLTIGGIQIIPYTGNNYEIGVGIEHASRIVTMPNKKGRDNAKA